MKKQNLAFGISLVLALAVTAPANHYKVVGESAEFYFGHISYVDVKPGGAVPLVLREGKETPDTAVVNLPLGPGDIIQTSDASRCEIQFDNGTIVRLDVNTKLKIETILAKSLSTATKISNLLLARGQVYVMYRRYDSVETFQVITPKAAVKLSDNAVALIEMAGGEAAVQVERGRADVLFGRDKDNVGEKKVSAGERLVVDDEDVLQPVTKAAPSEFRTWNEGINANFAKLHEANFLPKPHQNLPKAVFDFAQKFGNANGEWIWHDLYGYVWRPYLNDFGYPWGMWQANWQPYFYGNWNDYRGKLYWVPGEPWGWVPYHLGLWMWDKKAGWVWMPGSLFASAWVDWDFFFGDYMWRPFSLFDFEGGMFYSEYDFFYWPGWNLYYPGGGFDGVNPPTAPPVRDVVTKDGLKRKPGPTFPVPKELKGPLQAVQAALRRHDEGVLASYRETIRQSVIVRKEDFGRPGWESKVVPFDRFLAARDTPGGGAPIRMLPSETVARIALRQFSDARVQVDLNARLGGSNTQGQARAISRRDFFFEGAGRSVRPDTVGRRADGSGGREPSGGPGRDRISGQDLQSAASPAGSAVKGADRVPSADLHGGREGFQPGIRFRDWNPDVRAAIRLGVNIVYSTRTNEVFCPQLGLRSGNVSPVSRLSPGSLGGSSFGPGGGQGSSGVFAGAGSLSAGPGSSAGASSSSSSPRGSSKESGGGKQN